MIQKKGLVPLPWNAGIAENREEAIKQDIWRWNIDISYTAHLVWDQDEYSYKSLCGHEYNRGYAPLYFAPSNAKHCKRCRVIVENQNKEGDND